MARSQVGLRFALGGLFMSLLGQSFGQNPTLPAGPFSGLLRGLYQAQPVRSRKAKRRPLAVGPAHRSRASRP
jgi:hypothetical protein